MSALSVSKDGLDIASETRRDAIAVKLSGTCDSQTQPLLDRFFGELHVEAVRLGVKAVLLDCENLYFMNSSSVKSFVKWLTNVSALPTLKRYRIAVRTNRHLPWHHRTFGTISRSVPEILAIEDQ